MSDLTVRLTENQALKNLAYDIEIKIYRSGAQIVPTSVTLTVKDPGGTVQVEDVSLTPSVAGTITYELATAYTGTLWENALLELSYVDEASNAQKETLFFDVVLSVLKCAVIDTDLTDYEPDLASHRWSSQTTYDKQIQKAFEQVKRDIKNKGRRPEMLIDGSQVKEVVIYKTLSIICFSFAKDVDEDIWWHKYLKWEDMFKTEFEKLVIKYDESESGTIEDEEKQDTVGAIFFRR